MGDDSLPRWLIFTLLLAAALSFTLGSYLEIERTDLLFAHPYWSNLLSSVTGFCTSASIATIVIRKAQIRHKMNQKLAEVRPLTHELAGQALEALADLLRATGVPDTVLKSLPTGPSVRLHQRLAAGRAKEARDSFLAVMSVHWVVDFLLDPIIAIRAVLESRRREAQSIGKRASGRHPASSSHDSTSDDHIRLRALFNREDRMARAVSAAGKWEGSEFNSLENWDLRSGKYSPATGTKSDPSDVSVVLAPARTDGVHAYTQGIRLVPWMASDQALEPVGRQLEELATRIREVDFAPLDAVPLLHILGSCEYLWRRWADLRSSEDDWRDPIKALRWASDTGDIDGYARDPLAAIRQYERDCRLPEHLATTLASLWAALLDLGIGKPLAPILREQLTP